MFSNHLHLTLQVLWLTTYGTNCLFWQQVLNPTLFFSLHSVKSSRYRLTHGRAPLWPQIIRQCVVKYLIIFSTLPPEIRPAGKGLRVKFMCVGPLSTTSFGRRVRGGGLPDICIWVDAFRLHTVNNIVSCPKMPQIVPPSSFGKNLTLTIG